MPKNINYKGFLTEFVITNKHSSFFACGVNSYRVQKITVGMQKCFNPDGKNPFLLGR